MNLRGDIVMGVRLFCLSAATVLVTVVSRILSAKTTAAAAVSKST